MKRSILLLLPVLFCSFQSNSQTPDVLIREVMAQQEQCWNSGDLECFMEGYWESDQLVFIGSKGLTYGWNKTLENYKKGYPTPEKMGKLTFSIKVVEPLGEDFWFVIGGWHLARVDGDLEGHFSLIWRNIEGNWKIVADHSS